MSRDFVTGFIEAHDWLLSREEIEPVIAKHDEEKAKEADDNEEHLKPLSDFAPDDGWMKGEFSARRFLESLDRVAPLLADLGDPKVADRHREALYQTFKAWASSLAGDDAAYDLLIERVSKKLKR